MAPLRPRGPPRKVFASRPLEVSPPPGDLTMMPLNWKLRPPLATAGSSRPRISRRRRGSRAGRGPGPEADRPGDWTAGSQRRGAWEAGHGRASPSAVLPATAVIGKPRPNPRATQGPGPSGAEVWVAPPGEEPRPPEMPAGGKGNAERALEGGVTSPSWDHGTGGGHEDCSRHEQFLLVLS